MKVIDVSLNLIQMLLDNLQKVEFTRLSCWQCLPAFFFNGLSLTTCRRPRKKPCHVLPNSQTTHINAGLSSTCMPKIGTSAGDGQVASEVFAAKS